MPRTRPSASSTLSISLCLSIAYALILTTICAPFVVPKVYAARRSNHSSTIAANKAASPSSSLSLAASATSLSVNTVGGSSSRHREGELIVRFRPTTSEGEKTAIVEGRGVHRQKKLRGESNIEKLTLPANQDAVSAAAELRTNPNIEFVEPNYLVTKDDTTPNDPSFAQQWALHNSLTAGADINVMPAWDTTTGSSSTVIAVIDSGIDFSHPDLTNNEWTNPSPGTSTDVHGWDYVADSPLIKDEQGHGTAIAGIIAAEGNNAAGITGVMWHASLMSLRVLDNTGSGDVASAVEAIDYAVAHGAQVINLSWGTDAQSTALSDAIDRAGRRGVVVVCSAGNDGRDIESTGYYPASYGLPNMVSVAATDSADQLASWSNYGSAHVTLAAPGVDILTTKMNGGYWTVSGTSASAPLVTGVAGLIRTVRPQLSSRNTVAAITSGARQVSSLTGKVSAGGIVNAAGALTALQNMDTAPAGYGNNGNGNGQGNGNNTGGNGNGNNNGGGNAKQTPAFQPHDKGHGSRVAPPPTTKGTPGPNLPNLDEARKLKSYTPQPSPRIQSNLMPICDIDCGGASPMGGAGGSDPYFATARNQPVNQTGKPGVNLGSRNYNWGTSLVSLKGRAGLDFNIGLSYNSLVWTKQGSTIQFNADHGFPGPGFQLGFPTVQPRYYDSQAGTWAYMMVTPSGGRTSMRQVGSSNTYESQDGAYTQLVDNGGGSMVVRTMDGTQFIFSPSPANTGESKCTQIEDRNGNFITINYNTLGRPQTVIDTLGRTINFNYNAQNYLDTITQTWLDSNNQPTTHPWATFSYGEQYVSTNFPGLSVVGPNNSTIPILTQVSMADGSSYKFDYTIWGQIYQIERFAADNHRLSYSFYNLPGDTNTAQSDCPRFTYRADWAENWNNGNLAYTNYSVDPGGTWTDETAPDNTRHRELFATSGWQSGLTIGTEEYDAAGIKQKWTSTVWTQDNIYAGYQINPRPTETNIYDASGNRHRTVIGYNNPFPLPEGVTCTLPSDVIEYEADATTVLRRTHTDYNTNSVYLNRHIIGLPSGRYLYNINDTLQSKTLYDYDWPQWPGMLTATPSTPTQHDEANFGAGTAAGRGNLVWEGSYDIVTNQLKEHKWGYYTTGTLAFDRDGSGHQTSISYTDAGMGGGNTFAYPTTVTDPDGYQSTAQYRYDMGAVTHTQAPAPAGQTQGAIQDFTYDSVGRIQQVTLANNGAYTRYVYPASQNYVQTYSTIQEYAGEAYAWQLMDGAGRVRATASEHPGSNGFYRGQYINYDAMGRVASKSNPTEMNGVWTPTGDDAAWVYTNQAYDWKGRPTVTTNADGTQQINTYGGCGCAGGEVATATDEAGRQKRTTMDVAGRLKTVEELSANGSVYATTNYTYNVRDQLTQINQEGQLRTFDYDGFGRLRTRTTPEQGATTYDYNDDDTVQKITDARTATTNFTYNARHLVSNISYVPAGTAVTTPSVAYGYDGAGNRTSMTDGQGSTSYGYDPLSRLTSETRSFSGVGSYTLSYGYNISGELTSVTNPWNVQVSYSHDKVGRINGVTGANYGGVSSYITSLGYRAFDAAKQINYGNGLNLSMSYNNRLLMTQWNVAGVMGNAYSYNNYGENNTGRVTYAQNLYDRTLDRSNDYDQVGRLTDAYTGSEAQATIGQNTWGHPDGPYAQLYSYDKYGNITQRQGWGGWNASYTASYTDNKRAGLTYDNVGNLISDGGQTFTYDVNNKMITSSWYGLQQGYDGDGQRVRKDENGGTTYYLRSSALGGQVICEISGSGVWQKGYVYLGGQMLAMQQSGAVTYVHQDPVTKSQRMTDTLGNVVAGATIELDPFGGETGRTSNNRQSHVFTSYERDAAGMDEAGARKYHGWWSRFDQPDPYDGSYNMADPQSFNRYSYTQNDPVNFTDPSGLEMKASDGGFCGAEYSFSDCGGWGGITGGYFGGDYAEYQSNYGWLPSGAVEEYQRYEQRVSNAMGGNGFRTNDEVNRAISFSIFYEIYSDGTYATNFGIFVNVSSGNAYGMFPYKGQWGYAGGGEHILNVNGDIIGYTGRGLETDWNAQLAIGSLLNGARSLIGAGINVLLSRFTAKTGTNAVVEWLGPGTRTITNKAGDKIFLSQDGLRRLRFDFIRPSPHVNPHIHVDEFINGAWKTTRIYPVGVPPH